MSATHTLIETMLRGNTGALARLITMVENNHPDTFTIMKNTFPYSKGAYVIGITGFPGAGKSSIVDRLIALYRQRDLTVGVIAVDPSSPLSGGALLGDRIRMKTPDDGVFIRSMAARGFIGGLTRNALEIVTLFSACGFDRIIVETVGVGQNEVDIMGLAHVCVVTIIPGLGDDVQALKAGLFEIADIFVVNKMDEFDPSTLMTNLEGLTSCRKESTDEKRRPDIIPVSAKQNENMGHLFEAIERRWCGETATAPVSQSHRERMVDERIQSALSALLLRTLGKEYNDFRKRMEHNNSNIYNEIEHLLKIDHRRDLAAP